MNRDFIDLKAISSFMNDPVTTPRFKEELANARYWLDLLVKATPNATRYFTFGNHEVRLQRYLIKKSPELSDILALEDLLELDKEWIVVNKSTKENYVQIGDLYVGHWDRVSKHSSYTVKNIIDDYGVNIIQSHTHRLGMYTKRYMDRTVYGWEIGCLQELSPDWAGHVNWQHGFAVLEPYDRGKQYTMFLVKINNGNGDYSFSYAGKRFSVKK